MESTAVICFRTGTWYECESFVCTYRQNIFRMNATRVQVSVCPSYQCPCRVRAAARE